MKQKLFFTVAFTLVMGVAFSQSSIIVSGGWVSGKPEGNTSMVNGFKIGGQYESTTTIENVSVGGSFSYLGFKEPGSGNNTAKKYHSYPICFYGKYYIGKNKLQGYLKAIGGVQFSTLKYESQNREVKDKVFGLCLGTGAGVNYNVSETLFLNLDYEFLYLANGYYQNGITNAVTLGVGYKL